MPATNEVSSPSPRQWPILFQDRLVRLNEQDLKTETRRAGPGSERWLKAEAGDILWIRQTWANSSRGYIYRSDGGPSFTPGDVQWKPSIHMPRSACRTFLELREKPWREPLQDLTVQGALAEGIRRQADVILPGAQEYLDFEGTPHPYATAAFSVGWDRINAPRGLGWNANPTVTVLRYRRTP